MITRRELELLRAEWSRDVAAIEKDYVLGWLLAGTVCPYSRLAWSIRPDPLAGR